MKSALWIWIRLKEDCMKSGLCRAHDQELLGLHVYEAFRIVMSTEASCWT